MVDNPQRARLKSMFCAPCATLSFYALYDIRDRLERLCISGERFSRAHEKLADDLEEKLGKIVPKLARRYWEYIVLSCAGEARHAKAATQFYIKGLGQRGARTTAALKAISFDPWKLLDQEIILFGKKWEGNGYGGVSWQKIAGAGKLYGTVPDNVFIDHVVDLTHNGGLFLDKGFILRVMESDSYFLTALNVKASGSLLDPLSYRDLSGGSEWTWKLPGEIFRIVERASVLGLLPHTPNIEPLGEYDSERHWGTFGRSEDIVWGTAPSKVIPNTGTVSKQLYVSVDPSLLKGMPKKMYAPHNPVGDVYHKPIWLKMPFDCVCLSCGQAIYARVYITKAGVKDLIEKAIPNNIQWGGKTLVKEKAYKYPKTNAFYLDTHPYFWEDRVDPSIPDEEEATEENKYIMGCSCVDCKKYEKEHNLNPNTGEPFTTSVTTKPLTLLGADWVAPITTFVDAKENPDDEGDAIADKEADDDKVWEGQAQETTGE